MREMACVPEAKTMLVRVECARFLTVEEDSALWGDSYVPNDWAEFVRLRVPVGVSPQRVDLVRAAFFAAGALDVQVLSRPVKQVVMGQAELVPVVIANARAVVEKMVEEANTIDRDALRERVQKTLAKVGL